MVVVIATLELHTGRELQWTGPIPRRGDHIFWGDNRYEVVQVQWHCASGPKNRHAVAKQVRILVGGPV